MKRFRGGLVFKAHRLCVSLNSRLESNKEEVVRCATRGSGFRVQGLRFRVQVFQVNFKVLEFRVWGSGFRFFKSFFKVLELRV